MIAVIAGTGLLPLAACNALKNQKKNFLTISLFPQINGAALKAASSNNFFSCDFYKASDILQLLIQENITHVLMIGKVEKKELFKGIRLDWLAVKLLASVAYKNDHNLLQKIVDTLSEHGITTLKQNEVLSGYLVKPGVICGEIDQATHKDISLGMALAQEISKLNIGQTVVVKNEMIVAVEAIEGTDACIQRGITLGKKNIIVCKAAQAEHNTQFDLPTLGSETIKNYKPNDIRAIAWLSSHTLIADLDQFIDQAKKLEISLVAF